MMRGRLHRICLQLHSLSRHKEMDMALPDGYRPVTWAQIQTSNTIHEVYILEDGRAKPYGPYKVLNSQTREVEEATNYGPSNKWFVGVNEIIGVPDPNYKPSVPSPMTNAASPYLSPMNITIAAADIFDTLLDAFVTHLASKATSLDMAARLKLENEARMKRTKAIERLEQALKR
jgi:hypothetical protein